MGRVHAPLLRPARAPRGVRPSARRGGAPAQRLAALTLGLALWAATGAAASADTIPLAAYRARLEEVRSLVSVGRLDAARELLRRTDAVQVGADTVQIDDRALAARLGSGPDPLAELDRRIADADRAIRQPVQGAAVDARLRALLDERGARTPGGSVVDLVGAIAVRVWEALGRPDPSVIVPAQLAVGGALAALLLVILVRGVRERLRVDVVLPEARAARADEPARRAREAQDALARGDLASAIHAYYRFALATLAAREAFAYDPALTDHELLARAAAVPHAAALRELVALNERVWFGLRPPQRADGERARDLAERVAG